MIHHQYFMHICTTWKFTTTTHILHEAIFTSAKQKQDHKIRSSAHFQNSTELMIINMNESNKNCHLTDKPVEKKMPSQMIGKKSST